MTTIPDPTNRSANDATTAESKWLEQLQKRKPVDDPTLVEDLLAIARHCQALPILDDRSEDDILGYDENGIPS